METSALRVQILNDHIVLVRAKHGVEVSPKTTSEVNVFIDDAMSGNYGIIIDRAEDHSFVPVDIFEFLNNIPTLHALAVVVHTGASARAAEIDRMLFNRDLEIFSSVKEAKVWLEAVLKR